MADIRSNPIDIAKYFISTSEIELTPLQVIKFSYIAYGILLGKHDIKLFDEQIQAWQYGPVINSIYQEFKDCRRDPVPKNRLDGYDNNVIDSYVNSDIIKKVLNDTLERYKLYRGYDLINLTHKNGTPWDQCKQYGIIDNDTISKYYKNFQ